MSGYCSDLQGRNEIHHAAEASGTHAGSLTPYDISATYTYLYAAVRRKENPLSFLSMLLRSQQGFKSDFVVKSAFKSFLKAFSALSWTDGRSNHTKDIRRLKMTRFWVHICRGVTVFSPFFQPSERSKGQLTFPYKAPPRRP